MKRILLGLAILTSTYSIAQTVSLVEKTHQFPEANRNSFVINLPYGTPDEVQKLIKKELKDWKGKYSEKKGLHYIEEAELKQMGDRKFYAHATTEAIGEDQVNIIISIDLGGAYLSSQAHPDRYKAMEERLKEFGLEAAKEVMKNRIDDENKVLKKLENDLEKLKSQKENLVNDIAKQKENIASANTKLSYLDKDDEEAQKEAKKLSKDVSKSENKIKKNEDDIVANKSDQEAKKVEIEKQKKKIADMEKKKLEIKL